MMWCHHIVTECQTRHVCFDSENFDEESKVFRKSSFLLLLYECFPCLVLKLYFQWTRVTITTVSFVPFVHPTCFSFLANICLQSAIYCHHLDKTNVEHTFDQISGAGFLFRHNSVLYLSILFTQLTSLSLQTFYSNLF